ncbi:MAG: hypothetical protein E6Q97_10970 [Desulfurellales bacterium]|nr:MAG: hypothetical protein E6Q97_10970 [Desulfurellales bacterium]
MNKANFTTYGVVAACFLIIGLAAGHYLFRCQPPDPDADIERQKALFEAEHQAAMWRDSADYYKAQADTVYIDRTKIKTIQQHVKALHNASLDTLRDILLVEPSI